MSNIWYESAFIKLYFETTSFGKLKSAFSLMEKSAKLVCGKNLPKMKEKSSIKWLIKYSSLENKVKKTFLNIFFKIKCTKGAKMF